MSGFAALAGVVFLAEDVRFTGGFVAFAALVDLWAFTGALTVLVVVWAVGTLSTKMTAASNIGASVINM